MTQLFLSPFALQAYFENVLFGKTMRAIAKIQSCNASTVLNRIRKVEDARDVPELDDLIARIEAYISGQPIPPRGPMLRETVLAALGVNPRELAQSITKVIPVLSRSDAVVLSGDAPRAAIFSQDIARESLLREVFLAAVAFGWLVVTGPTDRRVRRFKLTLRAEEATVFLNSNAGELVKEAPKEKPARRMRMHCVGPLEACVRRTAQSLITEQHIQIKERFQALYLGRNSVDPGAYEAIRKALPPRMMNVLEEVCGKSTGFEAVEKGMEIPARSAKVLVAAALETLEHAGLLS